MIHDTGSLLNHKLIIWFGHICSLARILRSFSTFCSLPWGRLRTLAGEEVYVAALAVVSEGGDLDCLGVHNDDLGRVDSVVTDHRRQILQQ